VARGPPGGLQILNTTVPPVTGFQNESRSIASVGTVENHENRVFHQLPCLFATFLAF